MRCDELKRVLARDLAPLYECREENGHLTIVTPLEQPDGDYVEFYLVEEGGRLVLTDHAETLAVLASYGFDLKRSPKRARLLDSILRAANVHLFQGAFRMEIESEGELVPAVLKLGQVAVQAGDLLFTMRYGAGTQFKEEVEEFLVERRVPYEANARVLGRSGQHYSVDFYVEKRRPALLQTLSSGSASYAETLVSKTVRMWYDVSRTDGRYEYVSVLDDSADVWKPPQIELLSDLSRVVAWGERDTLIALLAAR
jgi:hypothetical protein